VDWKYLTEPEIHLHGRQLNLARGKVLGGTGSINGMLYMRGCRQDYDHWNYLGNRGWSYEEVLPYFKKSEGFVGGPNEFHGAGGPLLKASGRPVLVRPGGTITGHNRPVGLAHYN
jgi:choline dehydrogenase